jgi:hypothetical protein
MKTRILAATVLALLAVVTVGCGGAAKKPAASGSPSASQVATSDLPGNVSANAGDLEFIRSLGKSHEGETLYALVVAVADTKAAADKAAIDTLSQVGDVQAYFVVEPASHVSGLPAGKWYVFETYRGKPSQDTIDFMDRGPSPATVYKVTINTSDPIPVVEDLEGAGTQ